MLYSEADLSTARTQRNRYLFIMGIPGVLLLAGLVYSLIIRVEWLTIVLSIVLGALILFAYGIFLSPLRAYIKHVNAMLNGRTREMTGWFMKMDSQSALVDGVSFFPFHINVDERRDEEAERLLYWDTEKEKPSFQEGDKITFLIHDRAVVSWKKAE